MSEFGNERFDWPTWNQKISRELDLNGVSFDELAGNIVGPLDIFANESLRGLLTKDIAIRGIGKPVDIFVWSLGEANNRFATKSGGLPYRPSSLEWPNSKAGKPMSFLGQFNFLDSADLVGKLPGELLLVFGDDREETGIFEFHLEWQNLCTQELVNEIPSDYLKLAPAFGAIFRRTEFPDLRVDEVPQLRGEKIYDWGSLGEYPAWQIKSIDTSNPSHSPLCRINSFCPRWDHPFTWLNSLAGSSIPVPEESLLSIGDLGYWDIFFDGNEMWVQEHSY